MYKSNADETKSIERFSSDTDSKIVVKWLCGADILLYLKNAEAIDEVRISKVTSSHQVEVIYRVAVTNHLDYGFSCATFAFTI